jgi:hypothetical protein
MKALGEVLNKLYGAWCFHTHDLGRWFLYGEITCLTCGRKHRVEGLSNEPIQQADR